jgi:large subunit ribosomal protein L4
MSKLKVHSMNGQAQGEMEIPDALLVLSAGEQAVKDTVVAYLAGKRAGTASVLGKGEVAGSNKKPWRQKGTGRARAGYRQSPIWRGGGSVFGPRPHSFAKGTNKKMKQLAYRRVLSEKIASGGVVVLDKLEFPEPKTKLMVAMLKALNLEGPTLLVVEKKKDNAALAAQNIKGVTVATPGTVTVYDILRNPRIIATKPVLDLMCAKLGQREAAKA